MLYLCAVGYLPAYVYGRGRLLLLLFLHLFDGTAFLVSPLCFSFVFRIFLFFYISVQIRYDTDICILSVRCFLFLCFLYEKNLLYFSIAVAKPYYYTWGSSYFLVFRLASSSPFYCYALFSSLSRTEGLFPRRKTRIKPAKIFDSCGFEKNYGIPEA